MLSKRIRLRFRVIMMNETIVSAEITAITPIHIGTGVQVGTYHPTLNYIPARVLRGMLGNYLFNQHADLFKQLKISEDEDKTNILFKPAMPDGMITIPDALRWCKGCGRLIGDDMKECTDESCLQEGSKRTGFMSKMELNQRKIESKTPKKSITTKCPITRNGHTSPSERYALSPYHVQAIEKGSKFTFRCVMKANANDVEKNLDEFRGYLEEAGLFYGIGGFRSRGYGSILFDRFTIESVEESVDKRMNELDESALLVLNSPAVFREGDKYCIGFREDMLKKYIDGNFKLGGCHFSETLVRGWTIKGKSRRDQIEPALDAGSCVEIELDTKIQADIEVHGIGEERHIHGDVYFLGRDDYV